MEEEKREENKVNDGQNKAHQEYLDFSGGLKSSKL